MNSDPWQKIDRPINPQSLGTNRSDLKSEHDFFWAKNYDNVACFWLKLSSVKIPAPDIPNLSGFQIIFESSPSSLLLVLSDNSQRDIFRTICFDLIEATSAAKKGDSAAILAIIITRLERWQNMLRPGRKKLLSKSEQLGLFGELWFFNNSLLSQVGPFEAASAWKGPQGHEQDFAILSNLIEIKTQSASRDKLISISSMDQLDISSGRIWLLQQTVTTSEKGTNESYSLQKLVNTLRNALKDSQQALDLFARSLMEIGFEDNPEYEKDYIEIERRRIFKITETFPAVTRKIIAEPVVSLKYNLEASTLGPWQISEEYFEKEVFGNGKS